jgi:hypothetical protein
MDAYLPEWTAYDLVDMESCTSISNQLIQEADGYICEHSVTVRLPNGDEVQAVTTVHKLGDESVKHTYRRMRALELDFPDLHTA